MPWNPEIYNQFKSIRNRPFFDLMELISEENLETGLDIGCGTGEQTRILSERFAKANFLGIDPSVEMLEKSRDFDLSNLEFKNSTIENFLESNSKKWDLVFSNAALQWLENHVELFPKIIDLVSEKGQLAIQMPVQHENILNQILLELVQEKPFSDELKGWKRESTLLSVDQYAQILFDGGLQDLNIQIKVYPIIANDAQTLLDFISGSTLIPYMERLSEDMQKELIKEFKIRIEKRFRIFPAIYAFKRLLLYGKK